MTRLKIPGTLENVAQGLIRSHYLMRAYWTELDLTILFDVALFSAPFFLAIRTSEHE